jgi:hypothetical protein
MNTRACWLRHPARAVLGRAAVAGVVLAGCSTGSSGSPAGSGSASATSSHSPNSAGTGSGNSGGSTSVVSSNSVPFPIAVGNTWTYKVTSGTVTSGTSVDKIAAVTPVSGGEQVLMDSAITTAGVTTHGSGYFIFHPDGSITYPFSQFNTGGSQAKVTLLSGDIIWPPASQLDSGQVSHDILKIEVSVAGQKHDVTSHITVKGDGTQSVTVPAGTYNATVVMMTESETIAGIALTSQITTWLASGVGPVKTEVTISEGGSTTTVAAENVLTSFTKG